MKIFKKVKKGFTLVELVVVIAIIAILSGVSVAVYVGITNNSKQTAANTEATSVGNVVRAAILMNADGFTFDGSAEKGYLKVGEKVTEGEQTYAVDAKVRLFWSTNTVAAEILGLKEGEIGDKDFFIDEALAVELVYRIVEAQTDPSFKFGKVESDGVVDNAIDFFKYSPVGSSYQGKFSFNPAK